MEVGILSINWKTPTRGLSNCLLGWNMVWFPWYSKDGLTDNTRKCNLLADPSKGKRVVICHAGSTKGFVPNSLLLCRKKPSESYADYHDNTNGDVFEDWFENTLLKNLRQARKVLMEMDNAISITVDFLKRRQQWIWKKKRNDFIYHNTSYWSTISTFSQTCVLR